MVDHGGRPWGHFCGGMIRGIVWEIPSVLEGNHDPRDENIRLGTGMVGAAGWKSKPFAE
jgi:hypothetical protein